MGEICKAVDEILVGHAVYDQFVQTHLAQANYYRDPMKLETYRAKGMFLNDINNEKTGMKPNEQYKTNYMKLTKLALVKAMGDTMVWPNDSEWFGIKDMIDAKKVEYHTTPGNHLQFPTSFLDEM